MDLLRLFLDPEIYVPERSTDMLNVTARYEALRSKLISLQTKICNRTGRDPLLGTGFDLNPIYNARLATAAAAKVEFAGGETDASPRPKPRKNKSTFQASEPSSRYLRPHLSAILQKYTLEIVYRVAGCRVAL